jgi:hydroxymethylpyrimidine pyrophosphatase-like HAD family hydrolase
MATISKPKSKFVMMDLDNTLIDIKTQQLNSDRLRPTVEMAQAAGWTLALNSDTPLASLRIWSDRFGIKGPIVAEKGGLIKIGEELIYAKPEIAEMFQASFNLVAERLRNLNMKVEFGSPIEIIFNGGKYSDRPGEQVVFANDLRKTSLGLFVLKTDENGKLIPDGESTQKVFDAVQDRLPSFPSIQKWKSNDGGLIVVSDGEINKRNGSLLLMRRMGIEDAAMIGDSTFDFVGSDVAKHFAVGNADAEFKSKADYIAEAALTSGVVEILSGLLRG